METFYKIDNMVIMLNDMKKFCCLDLKCSVLFYNFLLDLNSFCWLNKVFSSNIFEFICDPLHGLARSWGMNAKENMHEVRFPNIYILSSHIIYYIVPLDKL